MIQGALFTRDFLLEGIAAEPAWRTWPAEAVAGSRACLQALFAPLVQQRSPNEAETEAQLVFPVLERVLGWALAEAPAQVGWGEYVSPLLARVAAVRARILDQAQAHGWHVTPEQLDDRHVIRRMILKRVVHGVDKNPFAVELAKVALWLHTFTVGAPLSFLDHHLRCGDSIVGAWVRPTLDAVAQGGGLLAGGEVARVEAIAGMMTHIEEITDNDVSEVKASSEAFGAVRDATRELDAFFRPDDGPPCLGGGS